MYSLKTNFKHRQSYHLLQFIIYYHKSVLFVYKFSYSFKKIYKLYDNKTIYYIIKLINNYSGV